MIVLMLFGHAVAFTPHSSCNQSPVFRFLPSTTRPNGLRMLWLYWLREHPKSSADSARGLGSTGRELEQAFYTAL